MGVGNWIFERVKRQSKTLPQKIEVEITGMDRNDEVLSYENNNKPQHCL